MPERRILSIWFPRLGAERLLRRLDLPEDAPFAVLRDTGQMQVLSSLSAAAEEAGVRVGQPLRDAHAICAGLLTRECAPQAEAAFLDALARWAGRFSPWVGVDRPDGLLLDVTGCTHLFGGEDAMLAQVMSGARDLGLSARCGMAGTVGAAWALARYAGTVPGATRSGDAIDQEARATRSRAAKRRHWERGGAAPATSPPGAPTPRIAAPGRAHGALSPLPVAALRLEAETVEALSRLGLRRIGDLLGQPRAPLARRFGRALVHRLDQAMGAAPEPVSALRTAPRLATRLTLPEPVGLEADLAAALDRLVPRLCTLLSAQGQGARQVRLQAFRCDGQIQVVEVGLARASDAPERIRPLLAAKLDRIDPGFGIDMLRLEATGHEPLEPRTQPGHLAAGAAAHARGTSETEMEDLIARIGVRIGLEAITRRHPAGTHIPEKSAQVLAAAWSDPAAGWPYPAHARPFLIWPPEAVQAHDAPGPVVRFRWRGRDHDLAEVSGPERICPEWWLDEPDWRSGQRDYWQVLTTRGDRLWIYYAYGAALSAGWFCHGSFC